MFSYWLRETTKDVFPRRSPAGSALFTFHSSVALNDTAIGRSQIRVLAAATLERGAKRAAHGGRTSAARSGRALLHAADGLRPLPRDNQTLSVVVGPRGYSHTLDATVGSPSAGAAIPTLGSILENGRDDSRCRRKWRTRYDWNCTSGIVVRIVNTNYRFTRGAENIHSKK